MCRRQHQGVMCRGQLCYAAGQCSGAWQQSSGLPGGVESSMRTMDSLQENAVWRVE